MKILLNLFSIENKWSLSALFNVESESVHNKFKYWYVNSHLEGSVLIQAETNSSAKWKPFISKEISLQIYIYRERERFEYSKCSHECPPSLPKMTTFSS